MPARLMPNVVVREFRRKGLKPAFGYWRKEKLDGIYCCALSAKFCTVREMKTIGGVAHIALNRAKEYGLSESYINAYMSAYDTPLSNKIREYEDDTPEVIQARKDGRSTRELATRYFTPDKTY